MTPTPSPARLLAGLRAAIRARLPDGPRDFIRRCMHLGPLGVGALLVESGRGALQRRRPSTGRPLRDCHSIVFVCLGNILRSPAAAALFAQAVANDDIQIAVSSAGLRAASGRGADPRGIAAGRALGIDLTPHRARLLTSDIVDAADAVVVMDFSNEANFLARFPHARHKLRLLGAFDPGIPRASLEIVDPYTMNDDGVVRCYEEIARCVGALAWSLAPDRAKRRRDPERAPIIEVTRRTSTAAPEGADAGRPSRR